MTAIDKITMIPMM